MRADNESGEEAVEGVEGTWKTMMGDS